MTLWASNSGVISCTTHGGGYLQASVKARPNARRHITPLDVWERLNDDEIPALAYELGLEPETLCERHDSPTPCS